MFSTTFIILNWFSLYIALHLNKVAASESIPRKRKEARLRNTTWGIHTILSQVHSNLRSFMGYILVLARVLSDAATNLHCKQMSFAI